MKVGQACTDGAGPALGSISMLLGDALVLMVSLVRVLCQAWACHLPAALALSVVRNCLAPRF